MAVTELPDLTDVPLDEIPSPGLARAVELYRERLRQTGETLSSFNARI